LKSLLDGINLSEAILEEKWDDLQALFENKLNINMPLTGLFSYYDLNNQILAFLALLKPGIQEKIIKAYRPKDDKAFVMPVEHRKLLTLGVSELPSMANLCRYMKANADKLPKIPPIKKSIKDIQVYLLEHRLDVSPEVDFKRQFLELLFKGEDAQQEDIVRFFKAIVGHVSTDDAKKLCSLFNERKAELAFLFSKPIGIGDFIGILHSIGEGCAANIGTKINMAILSKLYQDPMDQVIFPFYCEQIFNAIANLSSDILGSRVAGTDIFQNPSIISTFISPDGLIAGLAAELSDDPKKAGDLIAALATEDEGGNYALNIMDFKDEKENASLQTRLASFLIVKKMIPECLNNPHFDHIKAELEPLVSDDFDIDKYRESNKNEGSRMRNV
jgi:hypothetical protein